MKKNIHPQNYREVAFKDATLGKLFIIKSTVETKEEITVNKKKYPLFIIDTSSASHPFYTGQKTLAQSKGRVERFNKRFAKNSK